MTKSRPAGHEKTKPKKANLFVLRAACCGKEKGKSDKSKGKRLNESQSGMFMLLCPCVLFAKQSQFRGNGRYWT